VGIIRRGMRDPVVREFLLAFWKISISFTMLLNKAFMVIGCWTSCTTTAIA
jgi:hypothetical protein